MSDPTTARGRCVPDEIGRISAELTKDPEELATVQAFLLRQYHELGEALSEEEYGFIGAAFIDGWSARPQVSPGGPPGGLREWLRDWFVSRGFSPSDQLVMELVPALARDLAAEEPWA